MPRKHLVASQTNKKQQLQAKIWLKLAREIKAAVKVGGTNPDANSRLRAAIDKAIENNLPRASIERNIQGAIKEPNNMLSFTYECYGPKGSQFIVKALTDNEKRTISNLRGYLSKLNGQLAKSNSVMHFFTKRAFYCLAKNNLITYDILLETLLNFQIVDIVENDDHFQVLAIPEQFFEIKKVLQGKNFQIIESGIDLIPNETIQIDSEDIIAKITRFVDSCENDDDIQRVITNVILP